MYLSMSHGTGRWSEELQWTVMDLRTNKWSDDLQRLVTDLRTNKWSEDLQRVAMELRTNMWSEDLQRAILELRTTQPDCLDFSHLGPGGVITVAHIREQLDKTGLSIKTGDSFLIRTGHYYPAPGARQFRTTHAGHRLRGIHAGVSGAEARGSRVASGSRS